MYGSCCLSPKRRSSIIQVAPARDAVLKYKRKGAPTSRNDLQGYCWGVSDGGRSIFGFLRNLVI